MHLRTPSLTEPEARLLVLLHEHLDEHGYQPSVRELAAAMGYRSPSTAHRHLVSLERKGLLRREGGRPRALDLTR